MQTQNTDALGGMEIPPDVIAAVSAGRKVDAIRLLRAHTGVGLASAKRIVDLLERTHGHAGQEQFPKFTEVGGTRGLVVIVIAVIVAGLLYKFLVAG